MSEIIDHLSPGKIGDEVKSSANIAPTAHISVNATIIRHHSSKIYIWINLKVTRNLKERIDKNQTDMENKSSDANEVLDWSHSIVKLLKDDA